MPRPRSHTKDALARSAMEVFWARGYGATSLDDLVERIHKGFLDTLRNQAAGSHVAIAEIAIWKEFKGLTKMAGLSELSSIEPLPELRGVYVARKADLRCTAIKLKGGGVCLFNPVSGLGT